jgi:O-antigen/teichoic acid export membrane protein
MSVSATRIAKNTLMLYVRLIVVMLVSLYTVRAVLNTLGVEDYGIYDVVAGIVTVFGFLSGQLAYATQRFLSFEIGRGNFEQLKRVFSLSLLIYVLIAVLIVVFAETIGLWFVNNKLIIPPVRMHAVRWIFQFSIVSFVFTLLATPFTAAVLSHEDMNIYALLSIVKVFLQLGMVILLQYISWDKLILYGMLLCLLSIINAIIYGTVCKIKYQECSFVFFWNKNLFKEIAVYNGWMLFASFAGIFKNQIINILLNQFFNPVVVAARSIAASVNTAVSSFFANFNMSLRPPIVKSYAAKETQKMLSLIFMGTKGTFFLMYVFSLPLLLEMPIVLSLWLKNVPEYAVLFTRLTLIDVLISSVSYPVDTAALAAKKIGLFEATLGGLLLFNLPAAWIALSLHAPAYSVMIIAIIITSIMFVLRFVIIRRIIDFPVSAFFRTVLIPIGIVALLSVVLPVLIFRIMTPGFPRLLLVTGASIISVCGCMYLIGLNKTERVQLNEIIVNRFFRISSK